jgi:hypothetical protein
VISGRTKVLLFGTSLPLLVCIGFVVWLKLLPYYDRLIGKNYFRSVMFSFHFLPWLWIWIFVLVAGLLSLLYDRRTTRKP